jgi:hypothetical protein
MISTFFRQLAHRAPSAREQAYCDAPNRQMLRAMLDDLAGGRYPLNR